jgi:hypothetical protein
VQPSCCAGFADGTEADPFQLSRELQPVGQLPDERRPLSGRNHVVSPTLLPIANADFSAQYRRMHDIAATRRTLVSHIYRWAHADSQTIARSQVHLEPQSLMSSHPRHAHHRHGRRDAACAHARLTFSCSTYSIARAPLDKLHRTAPLGPSVHDICNLCSPSRLIDL